MRAFVTIRFTCLRFYYGRIAEITQT